MKWLLQILGLAESGSVLLNPTVLYAIGAVFLLGSALGGFGAYKVMSWHEGAVLEAVAEEQTRAVAKLNADNLAAFDRFKEETAKAQAAVAESASQSQKRTVAIAKIRQENARAPASPTDPIGTHVRDVIAGLRDIKAARVADKDTGGKSRNP